MELLTQIISMFELVLGKVGSFLSLVESQEGEISKNGTYSPSSSFSFNDRNEVDGGDLQ